MTSTVPDVDLTDGKFYADGPAARAAYCWMRAHQPVFRDRNGLAAATTHQAVVDAERTPELFSSTGGIRPEHPGMPYMIDMDDPEHLMRRKLVNHGFTCKRVRDREQSIAELSERGECDFVRDIAAPLPMEVIGDMLGPLPAGPLRGPLPAAPFPPSVKLLRKITRNFAEVSHSARPRRRQLPNNSAFGVS